MRAALADMTDYVRPEHAQQLWDVLVPVAREACDSYLALGSGPRRLAEVLHVLHVPIQIRGGSRLMGAALVQQLHALLQALLQSVQPAHDYLFETGLAVLATLCRMRSRSLLIDEKKFSFVFSGLAACRPGRPSINFFFPVTWVLIDFILF